MAFGISVQVTGARQAVQSLQAVDRKFRRRILIVALNKAGGIAKKAAARSAPTDTGLLRRSMKVKRVRYRDRFTFGVRTGPGKGFRRVIETTKSGKRRIASAKRSAALIATRKVKKQIRNPQRYAHLVELGTARGVKETRFMTKAFESKRRTMLVAFTEKVREGIEKIRKVGR
jgi:HK97 gp10 family phage protein